LNIMESEPHLRQRLWENVAQLRDGMNALGFDTLGSQTPIVPVHVGPDELAMAFWKGLWEMGVFTTPALPPGVPNGQSIVRTSVNANHTSEQLDRLLSSFEIVGRTLGVI
ncbi:MAG TPA: aminotransferase class I/II-fold pyridoxal phosphate-dependent enzyme, partial [Trueperaceae bacterium]|nr:aminotransferase class I/II-fold pyridoxal phosphate-dependent enzyme [Trueperaceae bacterium]